jgi:phosphatidate cytidylyltransferase
MPDRRHIAPSLSQLCSGTPSTAGLVVLDVESEGLEGFLGGGASATVLGSLLWWIAPFSPWQAGVIALLISLMGFFGGMVMSAIKRDRGVKDWGWMIEGHGGVLDRLDSVIFAAPVFFHMTRYWWTV